MFLTGDVVQTDVVQNGDVFQTGDVVPRIVSVRGDQGCSPECFMNSPDLKYIKLNIYIYYFFNKILNN